MKSKRLHRPVSAAFVLLTFLASAVTRSHAQIPLYGNRQAQEYGDVVYRQIDSGLLNFFGADYNHTAIYAGLNSSHVPKVMEATGQGGNSAGDTTAEIDFADINNRAGLTYYGAYTKSNLTVNSTGRRSIIATAVSVGDAYIQYYAYDALDYYGLSFDGSIADISYIRCDGVVEYCYEANGYIVWWPTANPSHWSIAVYPDDHNDAPTPPTDPSYEFSPFAQRGAPGGSFFGQPGNTYLTRPSVINLPTCQLTQVTNAGYADVTIQATDESGIHYIGYKKPGETNWNYSPTQVQHPTSDTFAFGPVRLTNSGTLYVFAVDNGGNYPTLATSYTITVPPPDTTKPTVSITNPASAKTYTNSQTVTISATASDNIGVARVEFYEGATLKGSDSTPAYTFDWPFTVSDNGAHVWTARAYDAAGNVSTSSPVTLTISIDVTPPTVAISIPANGAILTGSPTTVSGTASDSGSPASGIAGVEVRVNSGSWSNATGTTSWNQSVALLPCNNTVEARSRDNAGNYSTVASNFVIYTPPNTPPNTPSNVLPANGSTNVPVATTLQASVFSDADCVGDTHTGSQWQVLNGAGVVIVADSGTDTVNRVSWLIPASALNYGSNYQWHVRYRDSRNGWSSYSAQTLFSTIGPLLSGTKQGTNIVFRWPTNTLGFTLQWSTNLGMTIWSNATPAPAIVSGQYTITNSVTNKASFYRLKK